MVADCSLGCLCLGSCWCNTCILRTTTTTHADEAMEDEAGCDVVRLNPHLAVGTLTRRCGTWRNGSRKKQQRKRRGAPARRRRKGSRESVWPASVWRKRLMSSSSRFLLLSHYPSFPIPSRLSAFPFPLPFLPNAFPSLFLSLPNTFPSQYLPVPLPFPSQYPPLPIN
jgi:hypothetical protein